MPDWIPFLFIGGIIAVALVIVVAVILYEKKRRERLGEIAMQMGLEFSAADPFNIPVSYAAFHRLNTGHSRKAKNVMHGELGGVPLKIFDYKYVTGGGKNSSTHNLSIVLADMDYVFDYVGIRSEGFFDRLAGMVGYTDTEIGNPEFDAAFRIDAQDPDFAKQLLQTSLTDFLLQSQETGFKVEFVGNSVMVHRDRRLKPDDLGNLVKFTLELLRHLPADLPRRGGHQPPGAPPGDEGGS
ncbi:MAG: hypothetical protein GXP25_07585 [Planctomycetes bacterium]|nr:hypothetical protein [Planctomycetota bacterium]